MVWGMDRPTGLGDYFPSGVYEGGAWPGRLMRHFYEQPEEVQKGLLDVPVEPIEAAGLYESYVLDKFMREWGERASPRPEHPPYTPLLEHELPTWYETEKTYASLASFIMLNSRLMAVDAQFRDLVEEFEPGVHKFYPIEISMPNKQDRYYILVVGQYFDSFLPDQSKDDAFEELPNSGGKMSIIPASKNRIPDLAFAQSVYDGAHLWRERRFDEQLTCLSDELVAAIKQAGLRTPKMFKMIAV